MYRLRSRIGLTAGITTIALMLLASVAQSATGGSYAGHSTQRCLSGESGCNGHESVSFRVSGANVVGLTYKIQDRCPDGHLLIVLAHHFPKIAIANSRFGGTFRPVPYHAGEQSIVRAKLSGKGASGTIKDSSFSVREKRLCHGSTAFTARRK
jgi:hypothetical protein